MSNHSLQKSSSTFQHSRKSILSRRGLIAASIGLLFLTPFFTSKYIIYIITIIFINAIAAQGLNFLIGYTGQISLGHGAFVAIAAYFTAILYNDYHLPFILLLVGTPLVIGGVGILVALPSLRLKGLYLAMITLAFHMVVSLGIMSLDKITGGYQGINVPKPIIGTLVLNTEKDFYYLSMIAALFALTLSSNLSKTKIYRAFIAIKEREISAQSLGISIWGYKTLAFYLASAYAGLSGCLFAVTMGHITPNHFPLMVSIEFIMMNIVGGAGSVSGILFGTILITILPYFLLYIIQELSILSPMIILLFADIKIMIYGAIIVIFLLFAPGGFHGLIRKMGKGLAGQGR